ncbi:hypothetical protein HAX54_026147 [Datura stramonium]|uniref:Uncharacterized protein n=1 Tax=Datura stramonium TaxID=4076 RepID=A0ABS8Y6Z6_DATST|nr:hypothetical protein [Datura stramonium]
MDGMSHLSYGWKHDFWRLDLLKYHTLYFVVADYSIFCFGGPSDASVLCDQGLDSLELRAWRNGRSEIILENSGLTRQNPAFP